MTVVELLSGLRGSRHPVEGWREHTPGERYIIRTSFNETSGAYCLLEVVADHLNGATQHVHQNEDEHVLVLEGKAHFANGDARADLVAGSVLTVGRGVSHAWCNLSATPLRMLVVFTPGGIEEMFRQTEKIRDPVNLEPILEMFGTATTGPALFDNIFTKESPRV
jgi:mannose-6-phosphate isomerase-like protein (cupin superfamily)